MDYIHFIPKHPYLGFKARKFLAEKEQRWYVTLRHKEHGHIITLLSRYRMEVKLGRVLKTSEQVDHKDEDKTNDKISNLQIITNKENSRKNVRARKGFLIDELEQECEICQSKFTWRIKKRTCSKICKNKMIASINARGNCSHSKDSKIIRKIKILREEGGTSYSIAEELGISRNTVMKYW